MDAIINILHSEPSCATVKLAKRLIQLETKLQYDVLSHAEYEEELQDVYFLKKDQNFTPEQFLAIERAFQKIMTIAASKFLDMETR